MGALYFFQSPILVTLSSPVPVIMIPNGGGSFDYTAELENLRSYNITFDVWIEARLPDSSFYGPLLQRPDVTLPGGGPLSREMSQYVPGGAPSGFYDLVANIGYLPDSVMHSDYLPFMKLLGDGAPTHNFGWQLFGWEGESAPAVSVPTEYAMISAYPNPFNPETVIPFSLPKPGDVSLFIYDIQGREVSRLIDGFQPAGIHEVSFNGSELSSGVYFARLQADNFQQTRKLLLIK